MKLLRKAVEDYHTNGKVVIMPDHLLHMAICVVRTNAEFKASYSFGGVGVNFGFLLGSWRGNKTATGRSGIQ